MSRATTKSNHLCPQWNPGNGFHFLPFTIVCAWFLLFERMDLPTFGQQDGVFFGTRHQHNFLLFRQLVHFQRHLVRRGVGGTVNDP